MFQFLIAKSNRNFLRLWVAQVISQFGDRVNQLALVGLIAYRTSNSTMDLAKLMAFTIIPVFLIQPFAGVIVDRLDRRATLFLCDLARGILVLTIPFIWMFQESMIPIYAVVFLTFSCSRFYVPAKMSIIPDLVTPESLLKANSLVTTTGMIASGLGALFGAFIIEFYGARNGFIIDALTYFVSAFFLFNMTLPWRVRLMRGSRYLKRGKELVRDIGKNIKSTVFQEIKEGFDYIKSHKDICLVINMLFVLFGAAGAIYVVIIIFIQQTFGSVTKDLGLLALGLVGGLFCGVLAYARWGKEKLWYKTIFECLISGGIMLNAFSLLVYYYPNLIVAMALAFCWGMTIGPIFIAANTIVHMVSDEKMRGKVFSALEIVIHLAFLVTMFLSSYLSQYVGRLWILVTVGCICAMVGLWGLFNDKRYAPLKRS